MALLVALRRPDLVSHLVFVAGVFHHNGWLPEAVDPNNEPPEFLAAGFVGAQGGFVGLDQVNLRVPRSLIGRGEMEIARTVDGQNANPLRVNIK